MKLFYRGASYDAQIGVNQYARNVQPQSEYSLRYRGQSYTVNPSSEPANLSTQPIAHLTYRGVQYTVGEEAAVRPGTISSATKTRLATKTTVAMAHRQNLYRNIQHRLQVAQAKGDQALIQILEQELQQIA